ncbi:MAG: hypothetical protein ACI4IQ_08295, partial [Eubacterium sp.]
FERFAAWDLYGLKETAYIKNGKLAYEATHSHKNSKDVIAKGMYFYSVEIPVKGAKSVMLPVDDEIVIISASFVEGSGAKLITPTYDEVEKRPFDFQLSPIYKMSYILNKKIWTLGDDDRFMPDKR